MKILILLCFIFCTSCKVERTVSKKTYVCCETLPCGEMTIHAFMNLDSTEILQYKFGTIKCAVGDTTVIKKYKVKGLCGIFYRRLTTFTQYKH